MTESKKPSGCGAVFLYTKLFRRRRRLRRAASTGSIPQSPPQLEPTTRRVGSSSLAVRPVNPLPNTTPRRVPVKPVPAPVPGNGISGELDSILYDYQKAKGGNTTLVRASSGNVMVYENLGNLRTNNRVSGLPRPPVVLSRALSKRADPEEVKEMGNVEFRKGRFAEALALYDKAIALNPGMAAYRSNKAAALAGLGRVLEAVAECKEAVRMEPGYLRAHCRLAGLYFRLGEAEQATHHYKLAQKEANEDDLSRSQALQSHLSKCSEAHRIEDWRTLLMESRSAISLGADSAPQVFAWQAEALMKLNKHEEADLVLTSAPKFDVDSSTKFFAASVNAYVLILKAQVDMASGRFDEAVVAAQKAAQLEPNNRERSKMLRRTMAVASARSKGNDLFKGSRFREACLAYGEGLDHDPHNAILLCNRAASRSKLGQWEKAIEDCSTALRYRPSYAKARLRRADCNAKLERWAESIQDYEMLSNEIMGDEEVLKSLLEAKSQLKKNRGL